MENLHTSLPRIQSCFCTTNWAPTSLVPNWTPGNFKLYFQKQVWHVLCFRLVQELSFWQVWGERLCSLMFLTSTKVLFLCFWQAQKLSFCVFDKHIEVATRSSCFVRLCVSFWQVSQVRPFGLLFSCFQ